jgi:hypothetical protein
MSDELVVEGPGLSQVERVVDTFLAPVKTFTDILRNTSWWLPFVLGTAASYVFVSALQMKIGWSQLIDNTIQASPQLQAKLAALTPDQIAAQHKILVTTTKFSSYSAPVIALISLLVIAVVLWLTINFAFGAKSTFAQSFAVANYAFLPASIKAIVVSIILFAGAAPENFTPESMLGTNPGYFISTPGPMKTFLSSFDLFSLWTLVLMSIGLSIVARTKRSNGFITVFGWWLFIVLLTTASKAFLG